jgi:hypothetical protein
MVVVDLVRRITRHKREPIGDAAFTSGFLNSADSHADKRATRGPDHADLGSAVRLDYSDIETGYGRASTDWYDEYGVAWLLGNLPDPKSERTIKLLTKREANAIGRFLFGTHLEEAARASLRGRFPDVLFSLAMVEDDWDEAARLMPQSGKKRITAGVAKGYARRGCAKLDPTYTLDNLRDKAFRGIQARMEADQERAERIKGYYDLR